MNLHSSDCAVALRERHRCWRWRDSNVCPRRLFQRLTASHSLMTRLGTGRGGSISATLLAEQLSGYVAPMFGVRFFPEKIFFSLTNLLVFVLENPTTLSLLIWPMQPTLGDVGSLNSFTWHFLLQTETPSPNSLTMILHEGEGLKQNMGPKEMTDWCLLPMNMVDFWFLVLGR